MFVTVYRKSGRWRRRGGRNEMYIVFVCFLYLGFNLLNISKTAAPDSSVCGSNFVLSALASKEKKNPARFLSKFCKSVLL